jgi:hypothetical protein
VKAGILSFRLQAHLRSPVFPLFDNRSFFFPRLAYLLGRPFFLPGSGLVSFLSPRARLTGVSPATEKETAVSI